MSLAHRRAALLMAIAGLALAGCASTEVKFGRADEPFGLQKHVRVPPHVSAALERAPDCCASLADLPYRELGTGQQIEFTLGPDSPVHHFDTGKSYFAGFRITGLPRPARLTLASYRSREPGSVFAILMPDVRSLVLQPTVLLLDPAFRVVRRIDAHMPRHDCTAHWMQPAFGLPIVLTESPADVAYLIVLSTADALSDKGQRVCGAVHHGMSPVGALELDVRLLPSDDVPQLVLPVDWYAETPGPAETGILRSSVSGLLVAGGRGLNVLTPKGARYRSLASIPYERIVRAAAREQRVLGISVIGPIEADVPRRLRHHSFRLDLSQENGVPTMEEMARFIRARITPGRLRQVLAWTVSPRPPETFVEDGRGSAIGQSAVEGGIVVAFPCGICQTGACPPQMLAPCAALFGFGAVLGGAVGVAKSLVTGRAPDSAATMQLLAQSDPALTPMRFRQCLAEQLQGPKGVPWQDGGLVAKSVLESALAAESASADYFVEATVREIVLTRAPAPKGTTGEAPWRLRIVGHVQLAEQGTDSRTTKRIEWVSETHAAEELSAPDSRLLAQVAEVGCAAFAELLLDAAQQAWRGR